MAAAGRCQPILQISTSTSFQSTGVVPCLAESEPQIRGVRPLPLMYWIISLT